MGVGRICPSSHIVTFPIELPVIKKSEDGSEIKETGK